MNLASTRKRWWLNEILRYTLYILFALLILGTWDWSLNGRIGDLATAEDLFKSRIALQDKKIGDIRQLDQLRSGLVLRMQIIETLKHNRHDLTRLLDQLAESIPDKVKLTELDFQRLSANGSSVQDNETARYQLTLNGQLADPASLNQFDEQLRSNLAIVANPEIDTQHNRADSQTATGAFRLIYGLKSPLQQGQP